MTLLFAEITKSSHFMRIISNIFRRWRSPSSAEMRLDELASTEFLYRPALYLYVAMPAESHYFVRVTCLAFGLQQKENLENY